MNSFQSTKEIGGMTENLAAEYLKNKKYKILEKNFRCRFGEIDIVAQKNKILVFVEVKSRLADKINSNYSPFDNITSAKKQKLIKLGQYYLKNKKMPSDTSWQIDAIAVEINPHTFLKIPREGAAEIKNNEQFKITHLEQAIY